MEKTRLNIFSYTDYRAFLKDRLDEAKRGNAKYSRRYLIHRLGLANSNYLKMVIDGQKSLSAKLQDKLLTELRFTPEEAAFFAKLVRYGQAPTEAAKAQALAELRASRRFSSVHALELAQLDYMTDPVALTLREWVALPDFEENPARLAKRLIPRSTPKAVSAALERLLQLGVLVRDENGRLRQAYLHQRTGSQLGSAPLRRYHMRMLELAGRAIDEPVGERAFSGLSFAASADLYDKILARHAAFLDELRALIEDDSAPERVYHLEMALFPLSAGGKGDLLKEPGPGHASKGSDT